MTIKRANAGVDPRNSCNGAATRGPESIIDGNGTETAIEFDSSGITLDGFTIQNGTADAAHSGVDMHNQWDNNKVQYNIIKNNSIGVFANCSGPLPSIIQKNLIDSNNTQCTPNPCASEGAGIYVDASTNLAILDNEITGHTANNPVLIAATGVGVNSGLVVSGNNIHDNGCGCSTFYVLGVANGTFSNNTISSDATGIRLGSGNSGVSVKNNAFVKASAGVRLVDDGYGFPANSDIHINGNSFDSANVTFAVSRDGAGSLSSDSDAILDASANWWGIATGIPTRFHLDAGEGSIDYTPWLVSATDRA